MFPLSIRKTAFRSLLFSVATLLLLSPAAAQIGGMESDPGEGTGGKNTIVGNVYYPSGRKVDKRLRIRLKTIVRGEMNTLSDDNGAFSFHGLASGSYTVVIDEEKDYEPVNEHVDIVQPSTRGAGSGETVTLHIRLKLKSTAAPRPAVVNAAPGDVPQDAVDMYRKALELTKQGQTKAAIEQLKEVTSAYPNFMLPFNELGVQYLRLGELEKANRNFQAALKLAPEAFVPLLNHGIVLVFLNKYKDAEAELRAALKQNEESGSANYFLGRVLARLRNFDEAEGYLTKAIKVGGDDVKEAHRYLGAIYNDRGNDEKAITELETYLRLVPDAKDAVQIRQIIGQLKESSRSAKQQ